MKNFLKTGTVVLLAMAMIQTSTFAAERCDALFVRKTVFLDPGIGVVQNAQNLPEVRLKLSHDDVFAHSAFRQKAAKFLNALMRPVSYLLKTQSLNSIVQKLESDDRPISYKHKLAEAFELKLRFSPSEANEQIPSTGAMVMVGPHVRAGVDGISMASLTALYRQRDDVLIVLTKRLAELKDIQENAILIDDSGGPEARKFNQVQQERIVSHLKKGGAVIIFPSGENATKDKVSDPYPYDKIWKAGLYKSITAVPETKIVPVFIDGQLSDPFHKLKNTSVALSATRLPVELSQQIGNTVTITVGQAIKGQDLLQIAENYARDREQNSVEDLTPAASDLKRIPISEGHKIRVNNAFLGYLRSAVYELRRASHDNFETYTPSEWLSKIK